MSFSVFLSSTPAHGYVWGSSNFRDKYETITFFTNDRFKNPATRGQFLGWIESQQIVVENESDYNAAVIEFLLNKVADLEAKIQGGAGYKANTNNMLKLAPIERSGATN